MGPAAPVVLAALLASPGAAAEGWGLRAEATSEAPLLFGGRLTAEVPGRLRLAAGGGWVPSAWLREAEAVAIGGEADPEMDRSADAASLGLWRVHAGWRPFRASGVYLEAGYARATFAGDVPASLLDSATAVDLPPGVDPDVRLLATSTLHLAEGEVGWEAPIGRVGTFRLGVAWMTTLDAVVALEAAEGATPVVPTALSPALDRVVADLETTLEDRVHLPLLALGLGFRL